MVTAVAGAVPVFTRGKRISNAPPTRPDSGVCVENTGEPVCAAEGDAARSIAEANTAVADSQKYSRGRTGVSTQRKQCISPPRGIVALSTVIGSLARWEFLHESSP